MFLSGAAAEVPPAPSQPLSADVFSFEVMLQGTVLCLPCPAEAMENAGWRTQTPADEPFPPGMYGTVTYEKEGSLITATIANQGEQPAALQNCTVVGLAAEGPTSPLQLPGNITLSSPRQQVLATCGAPDRPLLTSGLPAGAAMPGAPNTLADADGPSPQQAAQLTYTTGRHSYLLFSFDEGDQLHRIEIQNPHLLPPPPDAAALPATVQNWQPPTQLDGDWTGLTLHYAGSLYRLPAPVSAFLQNGWMLQDEAMLAPGGWLMGVRLQKGNQILCTTLTNSSDAETSLAGCFVTEVESSSTGADLPLALPGGLDRDSTMADINAVLGPPHGSYRSPSGISWYYYAVGGKLTFQFWRESNQLFAIGVGCRTAPDAP